METCILIPKELGLVMCATNSNRGSSGKSTRNCHHNNNDNTTDKENHCFSGSISSWNIFDLDVTIWTNERLIPGTTFDPDCGVMRLDNLECFSALSRKNVRFSFGCEEEIVEVENRKVRHCNWVRFVRSTNRKCLANMTASLVSGRPTYKVIRNIYENEEVVVYFKEYQTTDNVGCIQAVSHGIKQAPSSTPYKKRKSVRNCISIFDNTPVRKPLSDFLLSPEMKRDVGPLPFSSPFTISNGSGALSHTSPSSGAGSGADQSPESVTSSIKDTSPISSINDESPERKNGFISISEGENSDVIDIGGTRRDLPPPILILPQGDDEEEDCDIDVEAAWDEEKSDQPIQEPEPMDDEESHSNNTTPESKLSVNHDGDDECDEEGYEYDDESEINLSPAEPQIQSTPETVIRSYINTIKLEPVKQQNLFTPQSNIHTPFKSYSSNHQDTSPMDPSPLSSMYYTDSPGVQNLDSSTVSPPEGAGGVVRRREKTWLPCDVCGKKFDRPSLLKRHMRTHTGEKPHACDVCHKAFSTSSSLNTHRRIHSGEKPHECPVCGKCFTASSNLYYHRMTHKKEKPHKCNLCAKSFPTPGDLRSHMYVHNGSWPFKCDVCNRGFSKQTNLKNHMLLHTGDRPHSCEICSKKFALQCNLKTHMKTHEDGGNIAQQQHMECVQCHIMLPENNVTGNACQNCVISNSRGKNNVASYNQHQQHQQQQQRNNHNNNVNSYHHSIIDNHSKQNIIHTNNQHPQMLNNRLSLVPPQFISPPSSNDKMHLFRPQHIMPYGMSPVLPPNGTATTPNVKAEQRMLAAAAAAGMLKRSPAEESASAGLYRPYGNGTGNGVAVNPTLHHPVPMHYRNMLGGPGGFIPPPPWPIKQ